MCLLDGVEQINTTICGTKPEDICKIIAKPPIAAPIVDTPSFLDLLLDTRGSGCKDNGQYNLKIQFEGSRNLTIDGVVIKVGVGDTINKVYSASDFGKKTITLTLKVNNKITKTKTVIHDVVCDNPTTEEGQRYAPVIIEVPPSFN